MSFEGLSSGPVEDSCCLEDGVVATCTHSGGKCGPETITISKVRSSGAYRYHVHAWDRSGDNTTHIADNGSYVQVFYNDNVNKLLYDMKTVPNIKRRAKFRTSMVFVDKNMEDEEPSFDITSNDDFPSLGYVNLIISCT